MREDKSTTSKSIGDTSDPFQLQSSDHPRASLVSKPLNGDNYATWSRSMSIALSDKNKTGFINRSIKKPSTYDEKFAGWKRYNDMVLSWILNSVDPSLSDSVIYVELASDIASSHQETMSVTTYYSKMKGLWDELASHNNLLVCTCSVGLKIAKQEQSKKVMQFLIGLNDTYSAIRGKILLMQPLPSIGKIYARHHNIEESYTQQKGRSKLHCTHCNGSNHIVERCYHLHGFHSGYKYNKKSGDGEVKKPDRSIANNVHTEVPTFTQE
ncbi:hypothetical protein Pfo_021795 [Paulownia fortunei]|nr:hypothetical protein Pfo_021795 [Paulownia fortunei]